MHVLSELNYLAILAATVAGGIVGAVWYSTAGLLPVWTRANGTAPVVDGASYGAMTAAGLIGALAVSILLVTSAAPVSWATGLHMGLLCGVAIGGMSVVMNHSFRAGRWSLAMVDGGFHVVRFIVYGLVIGWWPW